MPDSLPRRAPFEGDADGDELTVTLGELADGATARRRRAPAAQRTLRSPADGPGDVELTRVKMQNSAARTTTTKVNVAKKASEELLGHDVLPARVARLAHVRQPESSYPPAAEKPRRAPGPSPTPSGRRGRTPLAGLAARVGPDPSTDSGSRRVDTRERTVPTRRERSIWTSRASERSVAFTVAVAAWPAGEAARAVERRQISMTTGTHRDHGPGGILKGLKRLFSGESFFSEHIHGAAVGRRSCWPRRRPAT